MKYPFYSKTKHSYNDLKCILKLVFICLYLSNKFSKWPLFWRIENERLFQMFWNTVLKFSFRNTHNCMTNLYSVTRNTLGYFARYRLSKSFGERSHVGSSQKIKEARKLVLPSPFVCIEASGQNIVWLDLRTAAMPLPVEKSCRKGNLQSWETENTVTSFCTCLQ